MPRTLGRLGAAVLLLAGFLGGACAGGHPGSSLLGAGASGAERSAARLEKDREAIRAMAGRYRVRFEFVETVALRKGYEPREAEVSHATEWVTVLEDEPERITLQHVLVLGDAQRVVKHWRQTWTYEDRLLYRFRGDGTWVPERLSPEAVRGTWSQAVFGVADAPRYEGVGRWVHEHGVSTWESRETWRPLPRREYTERDDYDVLVGTNRHTITPTGWTHEQDNTKLVLGEEGGPLVREAGLNTYERIPEDEYDFSAGRSYWEATAPFWADVRAAWGSRMDGSEPVHVRESVDGERLFEPLFGYADRVQERDRYDAEAGARRIEEVLSRFVGTGEGAPDEGPFGEARSGGAY